MKADKNYRMSKSLKTQLAYMGTDPRRHDIRRMMIAAEVAAAHQPRRRDPAQDNRKPANDQE